MDLVILGGTVIDGTLEAVPVVADVGVVDGRIVAIGDLSRLPAGETIDASGLVVVPGFIDPHTHVETAILAERDDAMAPSRMGVTTILTAPDGFGWAPLPPDAVDALWTATAGIHGPRPRTLDGTTIDRYLAGFAGRSPVNVLPQVPHAAVRFAASGWRDGPADAAALDRMRGLTREWLDAGAAGLSVGLDYEPGARSSEAELTALCEVVAERGGSLAAHLRYEDLGRAAGYAELGRLGARTGVRVNVAHERRDEVATTALERIGATADIALEMYPYGPSSTQLSICLPAALRAGGPVALASRMRDPGSRRAIETALAQRLDHDRAAGDRIVYAASRHPARIGREIHAVAAADGQGIGAFAARTLIDDPMALFVYHHDGRLDADAVAERTIGHPSTIVASDGIYVDGRMHPRGFGTFPRVLRRYVRETRSLTLGEAIHAMTGRTAARYRVPERGGIAVGWAADLVVLDPATVSDRATFEDPRLAPAGIHHVLVHGRAVIADGQPTGARPGRVLAAALS